MSSALDRCVTDHARERAEQRLGRDLTDDEWRSVVLSITSRKGFMTYRNEGRESWLVLLGGMAIKVIWDPRSAYVVTVLGDSDDTMAWKAPQR